MKRLLRPVVLLTLFAAFFAGGFYSSRTADSAARQATATNLLFQAGDRLKEGRNADAIFFAGSATALNPSAFVQLAAGDILIEAKEPALAKQVLSQALIEAKSNDPKLQNAILRSLDRAAIKK